MDHLKKAPKAYRNSKFLNSTSARAVRIMTEYMEPLDRLKKQNIKDTIVFFGSARILSKVEANKNLKDLNLKLKTIKKSDKKEYDNVLKLVTKAKRDVEMSKYYEDTEELAYLLTDWSIKLKNGNKFVICSGGGPGVMEAANRGAHRAKGHTIGFNISLPFEQYPNKYISKNLNFEFHYFFMRKFWFAYLAKALVIMPGGFGTLDELMEILTLIQTEKFTKKIPIIIYGEDFWNKIIDFKALAEHGVISSADLKLFKFVNTPQEAFKYLKAELNKSYVKFNNNSVI
jgi:uncharacterized protein (TIGR00730 family)